MHVPRPQFDIADEAALAALFAPVAENSLVKELDRLDDNYRRLIEASPFAALATSGPQGADCSPRGDPRSVVKVLDEKTIILPERRGNNRIDSLRNLVVNPQCALLFLIPGMGETLRVNGRARISADPALLAGLAIDGKEPKVALVITVDAVYFQCSRAIVRSGLWDPERHVDRASLPTPGKLLSDISNARIDGAAYDRELPARVSASLY
ncbi:pyridoxamine 5'-phosphate oxidase family protein [Noviherbaspirillum galbum]|uniref:Pyridoxamine 5'-phosphate oxidase family protein n=1 Tax=Noviherbaspirillum galbum TaxID=2709383 RepID=A0A6B3SXD2_9BURK|nr:pyridoxamine 5'-phosphate oxidase family protein [Noviherbaspirillum galbum]NEX63776.1 pyridoxamine 5'-phosphate oxidase family protein [Noviherbaspirillum galbum]